ncbi:MAG: hypothetical protein AABX29_07420 [Nanoarchaeota archaeon]
MNCKGDSDIIKWVVGILIILGIIYLLNTHAGNVRENPNATNTELIGETMYDTGNEVKEVGTNWFSRLLDDIFGNNGQGDQIPPSTINSTETQNETTNNSISM